MTKDEFIELQQNEEIKKNILISAYICYACAAVTAVLSGSFIDAAILLVLAIFIHLKKSFPAAVILLAYGIISMVTSIIWNGKLGGWLIVVAGVYATFYSYKLNEAWKAFQAAQLNGMPDVTAGQVAPQVNVPYDASTVAPMPVAPVATEAPAPTYTPMPAEVPVAAEASAPTYTPMPAEAPAPIAIKPVAPVAAETPVAAEAPAATDAPTAIEESAVASPVEESEVD